MRDGDPDLRREPSRREIGSGVFGCGPSPRRFAFRAPKATPYSAAMQSAKTITVDDSIQDTEDYLTNLLSYLSTCKLTKALVSQVEQRLDALDALRPTRTKLQRAVGAAEAAVLFVDDDLNVLLDETKRETLIFVGNDYTAPLYKGLFGGQSPSELRRFLLGEQLETQRLWPAILGATTSATLADVGARTEAKVAEADGVLATLTQAEAALSAFEQGAWKAFVHDCNVMLAKVFGEVLAIYKDPANGPLPADFVDRFFVRESGGRAPRLEELEAAIVRLGERLEKMKAQRDALKANRENARKSRLKTQIASKQAAAAAAKLEAEEAAAEVAKLEAELAKDE